jgi:Tfp pilus assembly protein PilX
MNERGIVLPVTLMILLLLTSLAVGLAALSQLEPLIARNVVDGTRARFVAEAGVEVAFNTLASTPDWNTLLAPADAHGVVLANASPMPGLAGGYGVYTVRLRNDTLAADTAITGVAQDASGDTSDGNGRVIVRSAGQVGTARRIVQVMVRRTLLPPFPAALAFPGNEAQSSFTGNSFEVDGNDWNMDGTPGSCAPVYGISVSTTLGSSPGANEAVVQNALSSSQKDNVKGKRQVSTRAGEGDNTIAPEPVLTPSFIQSFVNSAKAAADITLESKHPDGLSFNNIGSSCASDVNSATCWGTAESPKIVYIKGDPDPTSHFNALRMAGDTEGHGILIVEDGDVRISGNFRWNGPIIVTGMWVGVGFLGGGHQAVYGSVISNETANDPGFYEGVVTGNSKIRYSCEALAAASRSRKLVNMASWQEIAQ